MEQYQNTQGVAILNMEDIFLSSNKPLTNNSWAPDKEIPPMKIKRMRFKMDL